MMMKIPSFVSGSNKKQSKSRRFDDSIFNLTKLITEQQWSEVDEILNHSIAGLSLHDSISSTDSSSSNPITEDIMVHFACAFNAPLRSIRIIAKKYKRSLMSTDSSGRYPIHVSAKWGATPDVMNFLIGTNPDAAGVQDKAGKTPMHYVGEFYARHYRANYMNTMKDLNESMNLVDDADKSMLHVVWLLKSAAPKSANLEDKQGMNAIEYALESDSDISVIKSMQRACRDDWRKRKEDHKGARHEELAKEIEELAQRRICAMARTTRSARMA